MKRKSAESWEAYIRKAQNNGVKPWGGPTMVVNHYIGDYPSVMFSTTPDCKVTSGRQRTVQMRAKPLSHDGTLSTTKQIKE